MINRAEFGGAVRIQKTVKPITVLALVLVLGVVTACVETGSLSELSIFKPQPAYQSDGTYSSGSSHKNVRLLPLQKVSSEKLLNAEGQWNVVEQSRTYDPAQAHKLAREGVNTKSFKKKKELAAHFEPNPESGRDGKLRVLRVVGSDLDDSDMFESYEVANNQVAKPARTVSNSDAKPTKDKGVVSALSSFFGGAAPKISSETDSASAGASPVVTPSRKPGASSKVARSVSHQPLGHKVVNGVVTFPPRLPLRRVTTKAPRVVALPASLSSVQASVMSAKPEPKANQGAVQKYAMAKVSGVDVPVPGTKPKSGIKPTQTYVVPQKKQVKIVEKGRLSDKPVSVVKLRAGAHSTKTRLVIEVSDTTRYKAAVDGLRKVLQVKLENTKWGVANQASFANNGLLGTYVARENKDGSVTLEVRLKKSSEIIESVILRPNKSSAHRIVIDLKN